MDAVLIAIVTSLISGTLNIIGTIIVERIKDSRTDRGKKKSPPKSPSKPGKPRISRRTGIIMLSIGVITYLGIVAYNRAALLSIMNTYKTDACPDRQNIQANEFRKEIDVKNGYVAYFMGLGFEGEDKGYFVTFNGPYRQAHTFGNGIFCPSIPSDSELSQRTVDMLAKECQTSRGGCSTRRICSQSILEYYFGGGRCHE